MNRALLFLGVLVLSGCGHTRVIYTPAPVTSFAEARDIVEQVFLEDYVAKQRPQSVTVGDQYILLADGIVTTGSGVASAVPIGNAALAVGSSRAVTREAGLRIYYNSLGDVSLHSKKFKKNRYAIIIHNTEGATLRRVNTTSLPKAQRFIDALAYLRTTYPTSH